MTYKGYLAGHLDRIDELARQGLPASNIARALYQTGVRPPQKQMSPVPEVVALRSMVAAVRHALRRDNKKIE